MLVDSVRQVVEGVIEDYCQSVGVAKPTIFYSDSSFADHKEVEHLENREAVLKDIREALGGNGRALTCDRCFEVILMRPHKVGRLEDPNETEVPITRIEDNIQFLLLHELIHVKLKDSELKEYGDYHTPNFRLRFNEYATTLKVVRYRQE